MFISKLKLHNFRKFEDFEIELNEHLNVLTGKNGSGKSSILDALAISMGTFMMGLDGCKSLSIDKTDALNKSFTLSGTVDLQSMYPVDISAEGELDGKKISWKRSLNSAEGRTTKIEANEIIDISRSYQERIRKGDASLILPLLSYYGTGRLWAKKKQRNSTGKRANRLNGCLDCLAAETNEKLMLTWFQNMTIQKYQNRRPSTSLKAVENAVVRCCQILTGHDEIEVNYNLNTQEIDVIDSSAAEGKVKFPMHELSDGYRNTISMIADIAYRMAVLNPQLDDPVKETPGIILIDEVDLHLHPQWQQIVLGMLRDIFPSVQFIVTTHAPAVIASIHKENVILIRDEKKGVQPAEEVYGKNTDSILNAVMETSERPKEIKKLFNECYNQLDKGNIEEAERILHEIEKRIGTNDPELVDLNTSIYLEKM
jgi:predicted ATP-binding protein involved in virulence